MTSAERRVWVETIMGTAVSVHAHGTREFVGAAATAASVAQAFAELREADRIFSTYREDSEISRLRRGEITMADAHPLVADVATACLDAERRSAGRFSATWRGWFDPTGYVKGWAVERAARMHLLPLVTQTGATAIGINAGGDMQLGTAAGSDWVWHIGIADPNHPGEVLAIVDVVDGAVATSGTAERGTHIVDPRSGRPATGVRSATVVADSLAEADLWATVGVVAGDDLSWMPGAATRSGLTVSDDGRVRRWMGETEVSVVSYADPAKL
ncbi:FAD:protein FMN transferase [Microbacterium schleiferi]|uniref:FAD:protein FMN transferase n=1 Tax=Microbacterium schleiferi TaxID=69362 RepID=A0A7S8MYP8_9MICO|nr:FAD:protein FMN transferase [Microbacterium schleiferi]QPE05630.1 FAD:protein FMN transferase [Microbacterium schleiferi]